MTGASGPGREPQIRRKGALGRMALALAGASAVVVLLVGARIVRSPREPATSGVQVMDNRGSGAAPTASDLELGARPPRSMTEAVDVPRPPADSVAMPTLAAPAESVVKTTSARPDATTNGLAARKTTAPPRPALRNPPAKASVPDDGRDELILPAVTR